MFRNNLGRMRFFVALVVSLICAVSAFTAEAPDINKPNLIRLKYADGEKSLVKCAVSISQKTKADSKEIAGSGTVTFILGLTVKTLENERFQFDCRLEGISCNVSGNLKGDDETVQFDWKRGKTGPMSEEEKEIAKLAENPFSFVISSAGSMEYTNEEERTRMVSMDSFPKEPIKRGDSWEMKGDLAVTAISQYMQGWQKAKLKLVEEIIYQGRKVWVISIVGTMQQTSDVFDGSEKFDLSMKMYFDPAEKRVVYAEFESKKVMKGKCSTFNLDGEEKKINIESVLKINGKIEGVK